MLAIMTSGAEGAITQQGHDLWCRGRFTQQGHDLWCRGRFTQQGHDLWCRGRFTQQGHDLWCRGRYHTTRSPRSPMLSHGEYSLGVDI